MNLIRSLITVLIVALVVIAVLGISWWEAPPDKLAHYTSAGKFILGILAACGAASLWFLWRPPAPARAR